jgi:hypothetical protein
MIVGLVTGITNIDVDRVRKTSESTEEFIYLLIMPLLAFHNKAFPRHAIQPEARARIAT